MASERVLGLLVEVLFLNPPEEEFAASSAGRLGLGRWESSGLLVEVLFLNGRKKERCLKRRQARATVPPRVLGL